MAAAAAMVTIGVVKQAGQLSHRHERPSAREAACLFKKKGGLPFLPLGGAIAPVL